MNKLVVLAIILFATIAIAFIWWSNGLKAPQPDNSEITSFVIPPDTSVREIGNDLKSQGFIKDPVVFFLYVKKEGIDREIQAGSHLLSPSMTLPELVDELQTGSVDVWVTIPEGVRAEEIAEKLEESIPSYDSSWDQALIEEEGYLFPDTYLIPKDATVEDIISMFNENFNTKLTSINLDPNSPELDRTIILASLIEREAKIAEDRPIVASVLENRLSLGMALQIDATVQYAIGYSDDDETWWKTPTPNDLDYASPYNTYQNPGLPPGPISNPGLSSIEAAANPVDTDFLYYVNDSNGKLRFAETLDEHNQNIEQYLN